MPNHTAKYRIDAPVRIMPGDRVIISGDYWNDSKARTMRCVGLDQRDIDVCSEKGWDDYLNKKTDRLHRIPVPWEYVDYKAMGYDE